MPRKLRTFTLGHFDAVGAWGSTSLPRSLPLILAPSDLLHQVGGVHFILHVRKISNPAMSAYLQCLLLTGARREELLLLQWADVNFEWKTATIRDKVNDSGKRTIPLTPYVAELLTALPRQNKWVFSSQTAKAGHIIGVTKPHVAALKAAAIPHVSLHGLRRSFATLSEWVEVPTGVVAQIQGHKPSAIAEKHYVRRPIDLLRMYHDKLEAWILKEAGITA